MISKESSRYDTQSRKPDSTVVAFICTVDVLCRLGSRVAGNRIP
jgi:hypothetical protein